MPSITIDLPDDFTDTQALAIAEIFTESIAKLQALGLSQGRISLIMQLLACTLKDLPLEADPVSRLRSAALDAVSAGLIDGSDDDDDGADGDADDEDADDGDDEEEMHAETALLMAIDDAPPVRALERFLKRFESRDPESWDLKTLRTMIPEGLNALGEVVKAIRAFAAESNIRVEEDQDEFRLRATDEEIDAEAQILFMDTLGILQSFRLVGSVERMILLAATLREAAALDELTAVMDGLDLPKSLDLREQIEMARESIGKYGGIRAMLLGATVENPLTPSAYFESAPVERELAEAWLERAIEAGEIKKVKKSGRWIIHAS